MDAQQADTKWVKLQDVLPHIPASKKYKIDYPLVDYGGKGKKILLITGSISRDDLKAQQFLSTDQANIFGSILDFAVKDAGVPLRKLLAVPFDTSTWKQRKNLSSKQLADIEEAQKDRIARIAKAFKPDCIVFCGLRMNQKWITDKDREAIVGHADKFPLEDMRYLRGRVLKLTIGKQIYKTITTFDFDDVASLDTRFFKSKINLIGFFARDIATALLGKNRYTLPEFNAKEKTKLIMNMKEWASFYKKLRKSKSPSFDTETDNLNRRYDNRMLTLQVTLDGETAYVLPWHHPESPFKGSELEQIKSDLKKYFETGKSRYHIYQNAKFDMLVFRRELGVEYFSHRIWDVQAGEYFLDENRKFFGDAGLKRNLDNSYGPYSLAGMALCYGSFGYLEGNIGKSDRAGLAKVPLIDVAHYGSKDVIYPYHICRFQIAEAQRRGVAYANYKKAVAELGGDMIHVFTDMEYNGSLVDKPYIQSLMMPNSPFSLRRKAMLARFKDSKTVQELNAKLAGEAGHRAGRGLFGNVVMPWIFNIKEQKHQQRLFFDELQLNPIGIRKDGGGQINKLFVEEYSAKVPEVAWLNDLRKLDVLYNTFIKGMYKHLLNNPDMKDDKVRSNYSFIQILTTRSGSGDPNLQNIPTRGPDAKIVKREFVASLGRILVKMDYNAHEVRGWGNISNDKKIAESFTRGIQLRRKLRVWVGKNREAAYELAEWLTEVGWFEETKDDKGKKKPKYTREEHIKLAERQDNKPFAKALKIILDLQIDGDVHKRNYFFFFGVPPDQVTEDQRYQVKAVVFGTIYGKGPESLSREIWKKEWKEIDKKSFEDEDNSEDAIEWRAAKQELTQRGKDLIAKLFDTMKQGGDWIKHTQSQGKETYQALSPLGPVRHLWGYMHSNRSAHGMMNRRGPNSIIQGFSSNLIYTACRQMQKVNQAIKVKGFDLGYEHANIVHDSNESVSDLVTLPMTLYYLEHALTTLVSKKMKEVYGWDFPIGLEIEFELGGSLGHMSKWDYTENKLMDIVAKSIDWMQQELHYKLDKKAILKAVKHNWKIVNTFRLQELANQGNSIKPSLEMLITPSKLADQNLIWELADDNGKRKAA